MLKLKINPKLKKFILNVLVKVALNIENERIKATYRSLKEDQ